MLNLSRDLPKPFQFFHHFCKKIIYCLLVDPTDWWGVREGVSIEERRQRKGCYDPGIPKIHLSALDSHLSYLQERYKSFYEFPHSSIRAQRLERGCAYIIGRS